MRTPQADNLTEKLQGIGQGSLALPLGCVAVLNRKQEEIDANVSFEEMRRREEQFFQTNTAFTGVPEEYLGSRQLVKKLVSIQQDRIRLTLPLMIEEVKGKIQMRQEVTTKSNANKRRWRSIRRRETDEMIRDTIIPSVSRLRIERHRRLLAFESFL